MVQGVPAAYLLHGAAASSILFLCFHRYQVILKDNCKNQLETQDRSQKNVLYQLISFFKRDVAERASRTVLQSKYRSIGIVSH